MPSPWKNIKLPSLCKLGSLASGLLLLSTFDTSAAEEAKPAAKPAPATTETDAAANRVDSTTGTAFDYIFNRKPKDGSMAKSADVLGSVLGDKLKALDSLSDSGIQDPAMRGRYEKFLSTEGVAKEKTTAYQQNFDRVIKLLNEKKLTDAWQVLFLMGQDQTIDAGVSRDLANRVEAIWSMEKNNIGLANSNQNLTRAVETSGSNADQISRSLREAERDAQRKDKNSLGAGGNNSGSSSSQPVVTGTNSGNSSTTNNNSVSMPMPSSPDGKMELANEYLKNLEARTKIRANELKMSENNEKAKNQFLEHISTLFSSRRYYHVIMAADFYRRIFQEGEYPVSIAQQVNAALESNREVSNGVSVFRYKVEKNEIATASARLQEAFETNEFHPDLLMLDRAMKEKVSEYNSKLNRVQNLVEARDFNSLEKLLGEMKTQYMDFDASKPLALVNAIKLESQLRLGKAKLLAQQGNLTRAMEEFQSAAEAWPSNPDVLTAAGGFFNSQDFVNQAQTDFDRLVTEENYRGIYDRQLSIAPSIKGDATREAQFKSALEQVKKAEVATEKANLLMLNGDIFGAWETIELAAQEWPEDKKLNKMRAELSGRGADFVSAINKAKDAEGRKEIGYSLAWYVNAQRSYPASQIANAGIKRLTDTVLQRNGS